MNVRTAQWWDPRTWFAFLFWELRTIFAAFGNDDSSEWKAAVVIIVFEILVLVGLTNAIAVHLGRRLMTKGSPFIFLVGFAVATVNIPLVVGKYRRWQRLRPEFEIYPVSVRISGGFVIVALYVSAIICAGHFGAVQRLLPP